MDSRLVTLAHRLTHPVPLCVSLMVALSVSRMCGSLDTAFSVVACVFLLVPSFSLFMAQGRNLFTCAH